MKGKLLSHVRLLAIPRTAAYQAPLSMGFSRQEYWSRVPLPSHLGYLGSIPRQRTKISIQDYSLFSFEIKIVLVFFLGFLSGSVVKNPLANSEDARDTGFVPGSGRSPGIGNGNPLQYSCLKNSRDRGVWWATVHGVTLIFR